MTIVTYMVEGAAVFKRTDLGIEVEQFARSCFLPVVEAGTLRKLLALQGTLRSWTYA